MDSENSSLSVVDGVEIRTDPDGSMHFRPVEEDRKLPPETYVRDDRSWWQKLSDWWNGIPVKPYVKVRDLADPFGDRTDPDAGSDGKTGVEVGIKISF